VSVYSYYNEKDTANWKVFFTKLWICAKIEGGHFVQVSWARRGASQPQPCGWGASQPQPCGWGTGQPQPCGWGTGQPQPCGWGTSHPQPYVALVFSSVVHCRLYAPRLSQRYNCAKCRVWIETRLVSICATYCINLQHVKKWVFNWWLTNITFC